MLALPLTPSSPRFHLDFDCAPEHTSHFSKMGISSFERPSSPSIFTSTTMTQARPEGASQKRPKLSLQTSAIPITFGKSSTALTLATSALPATSPTVFNTFNNAYDVPHRFSPATASPGGARSARPCSRLVSPFASSKEDRPYQLPSGLRGILRNSPVSHSLRRSSLCPATESPRTARRTFFPALKKVTFRAVLEEEIQTKTYITRHSELFVDEEDPDSDSLSETSLSSSDESEPDATPVEEADAQSSSIRRKRKAHSDRQIEAAAIRDGIEGTERLQKRLKPSSVSRRRKRRGRQWEWTLGPLQEKETSARADTTPLAGVEELSPSKIALPFSAGVKGVAASSSPVRIPLPSSAISTTSAARTASPSRSPAQIALPRSATLSPSAASPWKTKAEEDRFSPASDPTHQDR